MCLTAVQEEGYYEEEAGTEEAGAEEEAYYEEEATYQQCQGLDCHCSRARVCVCRS